MKNQSHLIWFALAVFMFGFSIAVIMGAVTLPYTFTTGIDNLTPSKLNSNFTTLANKFSNAIQVWSEGDTDSVRVFNNITNGALPTNGDTQFSSIRAYYTTIQFDTAGNEDTVTHSLGMTPKFYWYMRTTYDTSVALPYLARAMTDTVAVFKSVVANDSGRLIIIY